MHDNFGSGRVPERCAVRAARGSAGHHRGRPDCGGLLRRTAGCESPFLVPREQVAADENAGSQPAETHFSDPSPFLAFGLAFTSSWASFCPCALSQVSYAFCRPATYL